MNDGFQWVGPRSIYVRALGLCHAIGQLAWRVIHKYTSSSTSTQPVCQPARRTM